MTVAMRRCESATRKQENMSPIDLTNVLKDAPVGEWIALSHGRERIVATAKTLEAAVQAAKKLGENQPVVLKVPPVSALVL